MSDTSPSNRQSLLDRWFLAHPATVDETYFGHMRFALGFAFWLLAAGMAALVHALFPALLKPQPAEFCGCWSRAWMRVTDQVAVNQ